MKLSVAKEICAMTERELEKAYVTSGEYNMPKRWIEEIVEAEIRELDVRFTVIMIDDGSFNKDEGRTGFLFISKKVNGEIHGAF